MAHRKGYTARVKDTPEAYEAIRVSPGTVLTVEANDEERAYVSFPLGDTTSHISVLHADMDAHTTKAGS